MTADPALIRNTVIVTAAYWGFTVSDGALRMLVLLHFHALGFTPFDIALLFVLYECAGIVTNFVGGWIGARYGLKVTLFAGLAIQVAALIALSFVNAGWTLALSVAYVMACQAFSGVAKDLTKMSSKSAVKLLVKADDQSGLFKWVALLTGSKNALKGVGFFVGGALLAGLGFAGALYAMAGVLAMILVAALVMLSGDLGRAKEAIKAKHLFSKTREINLLSAARVFLFASRDVWFVVGVPLFLYDQLGWTVTQVGTFMAAWVIGYGIVQAGVPKVLRKTTDAASGARAARIWAMALTVVAAGIALGLGAGVDPAILMLGGLGLYAVVFAVNSALHSYLILAYSDVDKVALNVGFYYMANAVGRLVGTLLSGLIYQWAGLAACLWGSTLMLTFTVVVTLALPTTRAVGPVSE